MNYVIKRDAIRAFGLYFSKIREFDSKSVPPERPAMSTLQAIILGMLLVLTPSALFLTWVLWQDGKLPPHDQPELPYHRRFENTAFDLISCAGHINDEITTQQELVARLRLINSCRLVLVVVGFTVSMDRKPLVLEDDQQG